MQWVSQLNRVSSKKETKLFSLHFALVLFLAIVCLCEASAVATASDITAESVVSLTNQSREENAETALAINEKLSQAAGMKAEDMIAKNYFSHTSPEGATPWKWMEKANYDYNFAGENLAMDFHSAEKMEEAWLASPTHRANILNGKYKEIGVAVKEGNISGHNTILVVVMFGSGDKNLSSLADAKKEEVGLEETNVEKKTVPVLPDGETKKTAVAGQTPTITSPRFGETVASNDIEISGRAKQGEAIAIFDNGNFVKSVNADSDGWFSSKEENLSDGIHRLALGNKDEFAGTQVEFFVDRKKPDVNFRLFTDEKNPRRFFLEAHTDKAGCAFQFDGEMRNADEARGALFVVDGKKSSAILRVSDRAGNKNFRQISIANYYSSTNGYNIISDKLATLLFSPENVFAAESGREAVKNNLGIAMGGINKY